MMDGFMKLFETHPDIGDQVLCNPIETIALCKKDIMKVQQNILEGTDSKSQLIKGKMCILKRNVNARFYGLPVCPELHRTVFPKNVDLGCFIRVTGTVVRVTQSKMLEYNRKYICVKCKYEMYITAKFEHRYVLKAPTKCGNEDKRCKSTTFTQENLVSREYCKDYQEIKMQEQVNKLSIGSIPGSIWVVLEDDLVDSCKPGDDVHICGTVRRRWRPSTLTKKCEVELVFQANYLEVCNAQRSEIVSTAPDIKECFDEFWNKFEECPIKGRDQILASVCPQVYGLHLVKLALLLTIVTGSNHAAEKDSKSSEEENCMRVRGQCHLLLVGDPGTGKSQLLRAAADLTPRSVFTSGAGSTRAGLTCSALREDGEWQLEAGALVLSDGGVCCIDEIGQLREHDRTSIHEAMEQQTISIAKAGIVCKLNTRCAIVAACNPKGHYDADQPLSVNVSLGTPLLSRFDLIFILLDTKNKAWDKLVSSYILFGGSINQSKTQWSLEKLQMYIALVGPKETKMTRSANLIIQTYYMAQRKSVNRDPSRTTVRMLDSLVRLSQAHCRLMYRTTILTMDAIMAVSLVDLSMQDCTLNDTVDALHSTIPKYPDYNYLCVAKKLLSRLKLHQVWQDELLYFAKILKVDRKTLETEIDTESCKIFSKYDEISDENIPLSSAVITSSYFNNNKNKGEITEISEKLNATLKKHSTLNKKENIPQPKPKVKRKRKGVIDTSDLDKKINENKKRKSKSSDNVENIDTDILKHVPSVNDIFSDLGVDLNFSVDDNEIEKTFSVQNENHEIEQNTENKTDRFSKLKQFQFKEKTDKHNTSSYILEQSIIDTTKKTDISTVAIINKLPSEAIVKSENSSQTSLFETSNYDFDVNLNENNHVTKLVNKEISNVSSKKQTVSSSQISIFESSDCDIDLDI